MKQKSTLNRSVENGTFILSKIDVVTDRGLTKRSSQPLAVPMFSFSMTSTFNSAAKLAPASGG
jgi:hypothetical protein